MRNNYYPHALDEQLPCLGDRLARVGVQFTDVAVHMAGDAPSGAFLIGSLQIFPIPAPAPRSPLPSAFQHTLPAAPAVS